MKKTFNIDSDIRQAETLPSSFYKDQFIFDRVREEVFLKSWQWIGDSSLVPLSNHVQPLTFLEGFLDEPILITKNDNEEISCLSNVCTHRGNIVVQNPGKKRNLICSYHGKTFSLNGDFQRMPEFEEAKNFPRPCDDLKKFDLQKIGSHLFVSLEPKIDFNIIRKTIIERIGFLPLHEFKMDPTRNKDYLVNCHWALYCDNYLEGFHIPFVHEDLNKVLDYENYGNEIFDHVTLQIGYSDNSEDTFDLPENHIDYGKNVAAYYFWVFPNMMFNFYPWGLSINIVKPLDLNRTRVSFLTYVYDKSKLDSGAGALLDKVEREDEFIVENVHKGLKSRFYNSGRFSPTKEQGVHYFHSLLSSYLNV